MRRPSGQASAASESNAAPARVGLAFSRVDLAPAIASGAIREQDLITVLTEMCRCLLAARRKRLEQTSSESVGRTLSKVQVRRK